MKKTFSVLAFMLVVLTAMAEEAVIDGIKYNLVAKAREASVIPNDPEYSGSVVIPESITYNDVEYSVTSIGERAFSGCSALTSIDIPNSVTIIYQNAFYLCRGIKSISIPNSVTTIEVGAFSGCSGMTSLYIPNSVTKLGSHAFFGCTSLTSVTIPNSVTGEISELFWGCTNLVSVTIGNSITNISMRSFCNCEKLSSVIIPNSVLVIGNEVFKGCTNLKSVEIGNSVMKITDYAFSGCENLETVYCHAVKAPNVSDNSFDGSYIEYATLMVPENSVQAYKSKSPWSKFKIIKKIEEGETPKCATPTITYENGKLKYSTITEGAEIVSEVTIPDMKKSYDNEVSLTATYNITAYATKGGMGNSDNATATLVWLNAHLDQDVSTSAKAVEIPSVPVLINSNGGVVTISGADDGTEIRAYATDGRQIDTVRSYGSTAIINVSSLQDNVAIIKIGEKSVKINVR